MENQEPKKPRHSRRKRRATAEVPTVDVAELEVQSHPVEDEPSTPEIEAIEEKPEEVVVEVTESPIVEPPPEPTPEPKPEVKPWKKPVRPMRQRKANGEQRGVRRSRR